MSNAALSYRPAIDRLVSIPWLRPLNDPDAIDDLLGIVDPTWSVREIRARVVETIVEAKGTRNAEDHLDDVGVS